MEQQKNNSNRGLSWRSCFLAAILIANLSVFVIPNKKRHFYLIVTAIGPRDWRLRVVHEQFTASNKEAYIILDSVFYDPDSFVGFEARRVAYERDLVVELGGVERQRSPSAFRLLTQSEFEEKFRGKEDEVTFRKE